MGEAALALDHPSYTGSRPIERSGSNLGARHGSANQQNHAGVSRDSGGGNVLWSGRGGAADQKNANLANQIQRPHGYQLPDILRGKGSSLGHQHFAENLNNYLDNAGGADDPVVRYQNMQDAIKDELDRRSQNEIGGNVAQEQMLREAQNTLNERQNKLAQTRAKANGGNVGKGIAGKAAGAGSKAKGIVSEIEHMAKVLNWLKGLSALSAVGILVTIIVMYVQFIFGNLLKMPLMPKLGKIQSTIAMALPFVAAGALLVLSAPFLLFLNYFFMDSGVSTSSIGTDFDNPVAQSFADAGGDLFVGHGKPPAIPKANKPPQTTSTAVNDP